MSQNAMEVVLDHLYARRHRDADAVAATLDPAVVHEGVTPDTRCEGRDQVMVHVIRRLHGDELDVERVEILDAGPDQAVLGAAGPRFRDISMASPEGEVFVLFTVRDDRIVRMRDFRSRADALAAARA